MHSDVVSIVALGGLASYGLVVLVGRSLLQRSRTGSTGWRGITGRPGSASWWGGISMVAACVWLVTAPLVAAMQPSRVVDARWLWLGLGLWSMGTVVTLIAQLQMGDAWRIGVRPGERTELCTHGLFRWCRNPIFTGMLCAVLAMVVWVPLAAPAWLALWIGVQLQVRCVEEPHLLEIHGADYQRYAARTGRLLPCVGRGVAPRA